MQALDFLTIAVQAALEAGAAALEVYEQDFDVEEKSDHSPLTLADRRAHKIITARLKASGIPVLSEEGRDIPYAERKHWPVLWIVDPLDGTKEFIKKNGEFTVNIALVSGGTPVMGVVFVPVKDTLYFAVHGHGAFRAAGRSVLHLREKTADELIAASRKLPTEDPGARIYTIMGSRSHASEELQAFVEQKRKEHGEVDFISAGSSLKFCQVAEGRADLYPRTGPTMEWDTAAGQALVEMAGGSVVEFESGRPLCYNKEDLKNPWFIVSREVMQLKGQI